MRKHHLDSEDREDAAYAEEYAAYVRETKSPLSFELWLAKFLGHSPEEVA